MESITEPLEREITKLVKQRDAYMRAINRIDDFFEYANESISDRKRVYSILDNLTLRLTMIGDSEKIKDEYYGKVIKA